MLAVPDGELTDTDDRALAACRCRLRRFSAFSEFAAPALVDARPTFVVQPVVPRQ